MSSNSLTPEYKDWISLLTVREASALLGMTPQGLYKAAQRRQLPCIRLSPKRLRFRLTDLERFITSHAQEPLEPPKHGGRR
jgi:excisionase family DNA binding protein